MTSRGAGRGHLDILGADVDLPPGPVCAPVDQHPGLFPLQFVAQSDGHNLTNRQIKNKNNLFCIFFLPICGHQFHLFPRRVV